MSLTRSVLSVYEKEPEQITGAGFLSPAPAICSCSNVLLVQVEDFVYDFPLAVDFEKREHVGKSTSTPILEFEPHCGDRFDDVDACDPSL